MMSQLCPINGSSRCWRQGGADAGRVPGAARSLKLCAELLLGEPLRLAFWRRSEMDCSQKSTDQHHQQIDFHFVLRSPLQALTERNAKRVPFGSMTLV